MIPATGLPTALLIVAIACLTPAAARSDTAAQSAQSPATTVADPCAETFELGFLLYLDPCGLLSDDGSPSDPCEAATGPRAGPNDAPAPAEAVDDPCGAPVDPSAAQIAPTGTPIDSAGYPIDPCGAPGDALSKGTEPYAEATTPSAASGVPSESLPVLLADPNGPPSSPLREPVAFWQLHYHPRVTADVFTLLRYPYHNQGRDYSSDGPTILTIPNVPADSADTDAAGQDDPNGTAAGSSAAQDINAQELYQALTASVDMVHQWRQLNESPGTALEVVYARELTRLATGIYRLDPDLAVSVRRIIGQIGRANRQFDQTSRVLMHSLLNGQLHPALLSRCKKRITDLQTLLQRLAEANDSISIALGAGPIDRAGAWPDGREFIDYSELRSPTDD